MNHHPGMGINFHFGMGINMVVEYYILPHFMQKYSEMRLKLRRKKRTFESDIIIHLKFCKNAEIVSS